VEIEWEVAIIPPFEVFHGFEIPTSTIFHESAEEGGREKYERRAFAEMADDDKNNDAAETVNW